MQQTYIEIRIANAKNTELQMQILIQSKHFVQDNVTARGRRQKTYEIGIIFLKRNLCDNCTLKSELQMQKNTELQMQN